MSVNVIKIIFIVVGTYFFVVFFLFRLIAPFYGFKRYLLPKTLPREMLAAIAKLEGGSTNQAVYLQAVYSLVLDKTLHQWGHTRFKAATQLTRGLVSDLSEIWNTRKFIYCTQISYVSFCLLAGSKYFRPEDIRKKIVFLNFVAHEYLQVRVGERWVDFDPAGIGIRGGPLGRHAAFFG